MSTPVPRASHEYTEGWCEGGEIGRVALSGGARVRYLRVGSGPPMVVMHTVRTQLDHFWPEPFRQVRWPPRYMMDSDLVEPMTQPPSGFLIRVSPP